MIKAITNTLTIAFILVILGMPTPEERKASHSPKVIKADVIRFKIKPEISLKGKASQPAVYCGVTHC
jgi:hypothetical protein